MKTWKKGILVSGIIIVGSLLIMACATPSGPHPVSPEGQAQCIPKWVENPPSAEDGVYGSGLAKLQMAALSKQTADQRARNEVVKTIRVKVETMLKEFMQQSGLGEQAQALNFSESVSKHISSDVLSGCKIVKRKVCPDGTWYSLALWPIGNADALKKEINNQAKKMVKNEVALYNEFKAKQSFEELQKEIDKLDLSKE